jgi:aminoglycoside phosphotransferase family enzyme/predicted kinase
MPLVTRDSMLIDDQSEVIAFLKGAVGMGEAVDIVRTHASLIFLAGERAFKLKRAVLYPCLDFSTAEKRLAFCLKELELNRRTAPSLYLGVRTITREREGGLAFDGEGALVDAVVEMRRFDQESLFDALARRGALTRQHMSDLAVQIARFHDEANISVVDGGVSGIAAVLDINEQALKGTSLVSPDAASAFAEGFRQGLRQHSSLLEERRKAGKVRHCHGDLILRNICLVDGVPTLFDCLEFDDALATTDVLYDLTFLLMDLWHRNQCELANIVFNRYLDERDEIDGLPLFPLFMAIRAAVRAHVTAAQAIDAESDSATALRTEAKAYFDLASTLLQRADPVLLAVGGLSGSGKSTVASLVAPHLGPAPGARVLNSDRIRKRLHRVRPNERLPMAAYQPQVSEKLYRTLNAGDIVATGYAVVADAVFDRPAERQAIEGVAAAAGVPFRGVWLDAPTAVLLPRLEARHNDPSDATAEVLLSQMKRDCGEITWQRFDASRPASAVGASLLRGLHSE